jgi:uncharacterized protein YcbK (DUF882 family)
METDSSRAGAAPLIARRALIGLAGATLALAAAPAAAASPRRSRAVFPGAGTEPAPGAVPTPAARERALHLVHRVTGEAFRDVYFADGRYLPEARARIDGLLRDWRSGATAPIDPALLDALHALAGRLGRDRPVEILSGYRTPETNLLLREEGFRPARSSLHMEGRAVDLRIPGVPLGKLRRAALALGAGGVGYYPRSGFVHLDTGEVRRWIGA